MNSIYLIEIVYKRFSHFAALYLGNPESTVHKDKVRAPKIL